MKRFTETTAVIAAALMASSATVAADDSFSGLYIGAEGGFDSTTFGGAKDNTRYLGGLLGFRYQMDSNMVLGIEGTYGNSGYSGSGGFDFSTPDFGNEWTASGLLGFAFGDDNDNLVFAKVGYTQTKFDIIDNDTDAVTSGDVTGLRFGGGYERKFGDILSVRLSVDYSKPESFFKQLQAKAGLLVSF